MKAILAKFASARLLLCILFFFSGTAALIYQVMWQRMLYTVFGIDLQSITIIVSVFMFGLGVGCLGGGILADRYNEKLLNIYVIFEFCIAGFGFISPDIINLLSALTINCSIYVTMLLSFAIFAVPTMLMGATFPVLVKYVNATDHHIGRAVGTLYFVNTLGGAFGAYAAGFVLLYSMGLASATGVAAFLNLSIAVTAYIFFRRED